MNKGEREEPLISIVIPAYNEEGNIRGGALQQVIDYLGQQEYKSEVIVVDDGSEDATAALVEEAARRWPFLSLLRTEHGGKAWAVRAGVQAARGRFILFTDMDQSTPIRFLEEMIRELEGGQDVVIGSRWLKGSLRLDEPWSRRALGKAFSFLVRLLLLPEVRDSQCGFKGFRREVAQEVFAGLWVFAPGGPRARGPMVTAFDVELLVAAKQRGYRIKEIAVTWRHVPTRRVRPLRDSLRMFRQVVAVWLNKMRGKYEVPGANP